MNFADVFIDSLRYPFTDLKKLLIVLILVSITVFMGQFILITIPISIIVYGYMMRIIESTLEGSNEFPAFNDLKKLIIDGIKFNVSLIFLSLDKSILKLLSKDCLYLSETLA